jgi:hypothetical protein
MQDDASEPQAPALREHRITDMHIIAWAMTVVAFGTIWIAFQLTLIAADL